MEKKDKPQDEQNDDTKYSQTQFPFSDEIRENKDKTSTRKGMTSDLADISNLEKSKENTGDKMKKLNNWRDEFRKLDAEHTFHLHNQDNTNTRSVDKSSINSPSKKKSKSNRKAGATSKKHVKEKPKVCNLQTLLDNEETREDGLFYSLIAEKDIASFLSGDSSSLNKTLTSTKPREKTELPKIDKNRKSKSSNLSKIPQFSGLERTLKSSRLLKETNSIENPSIMSKLLRSLQEINLNEPNLDKKENISENTDASIEIGVSLSDKTYEEIESYFSLFKQGKIVPSPRESSDSGTLTPDSDDLDPNSRSPRSLKRSKPVKHSAKPNLAEVSSKSDSPEPDGVSYLSTVKKQSHGNTEPAYLRMESKLSFQSGRPKAFDASVRPKVPDLSVRPKVPDLSVRPKVPDLSVRPKVPDASVRPKVPDTSVRSIVPGSSVRPKIADSSERLKVPDTSFKTKIPDPSLKPKAPNSSLRIKVPDPSSRAEKTDSSKIADSSMKKKVPKLTLKSKFPGSLIKSTLAEEREEIDETATDAICNSEQTSQHCMVDPKLKHYVISRRLSFSEIRQTAENVQVFMNKTAVLKPEYRDDVKVTNSRRMRNAASDWLNLVFYWDLVKQEVNMIVETIDALYVSEDISMSREEFHYFMRQILKVFKDILNLICLTQNGFARYTKLCSSHDMYMFLSHVVTFESRVLPLFKKLRAESEQFAEYKKQENN